MLKSLLKEIRRGLDRSDARSPSSSSAAAPSDEAQRQAFASADMPTRTKLADDLRARLADTDGGAADWCRLGDWLLQLQQVEPAQHAFRRALQREALHTRSHEGLGLALLQSGQLEEAFLRLETANKLDPQNVEILVHWGLVDLALNKFAIAAGRFEKAIERNPSNHHAWHNLGIASIKQGLVDNGVKQLERAINLSPGFAAGHMNLALALVQCGRLEEAIACASRSTELAPHQAGGWRALAEARRCNGEVSAAREAAARAMALGPQHAATHLEAGLLDWLEGKVEPAGQHFREALRLDPSSADGQFALAEWHLAQAQWTHGWPLYESRRRRSPSPIRPMPFLEWQGEALEGDTLLVHSEQGLGDIILFASCLPDLEHRAPHIVLEVPGKLQRLFQRSFPNLKVVSFGGPQNLTPWSPEIESLRIGKHIPIGSLSRLLRLRDSDFATCRPYLMADHNAVEAWQHRLRGERPLIVGVAWRGGLATTGAAFRSLDLTELVQTLQRPDIQFVSLQYGNVEADLASCAQATGVVVHPGAGPDADLDDMASLTAACDAIITVCSTQAHLTGALGQPGAVLAPVGANWRYAAQAGQSRWYPSLTILQRGVQDADWRPILGEAGSWLGQTLSAR